MRVKTPATFISRGRDTLSEQMSWSALALVTLQFYGAVGAGVGAGGAGGERRTDAQLTAAQ